MLIDEVWQTQIFLFWLWNRRYSIVILADIIDRNSWKFWATRWWFGHLNDLLLWLMNVFLRWYRLVFALLGLNFIFLSYLACYRLQFLAKNRFKSIQLLFRILFGSLIVIFQALLIQKTLSKTTMKAKSVFKILYLMDSIKRRNRCWLLSLRWRN